MNGVVRTLPPKLDDDENPPATIQFPIPNSQFHNSQIPTHARAGILPSFGEQARISE